MKHLKAVALLAAVLILIPLVLIQGRLTLWAWMDVINPPPPFELNIETNGDLNGTLYFEVTNFLLDGSPGKGGSYWYTYNRESGELVYQRFQTYGLMHRPQGDNISSVYQFTIPQWKDTTNIRGKVIPFADGGYVSIMRDGKEVERVTDENGLDVHEFRILDNGNYLYLQTHLMPMYPDDTVNCLPQCQILGQKIIERTPAGEIITEIALLDAYERDDLVLDDMMSQGKLKLYDVTHANSIHPTPEGYIVSIRHTSEIIEYRRDGSIVWRSRNYEIDSPFSHQHDAQLLPNGNLLLFDNGNGIRDYSRAVEYQIDHSERTLTTVWEYTNGHYAPNRGSAQRLPDGNTLINFVDDGIVEVTPSGEVVMQVAMPEGLWASYQAKVQ